jgi:transcriptional regulator with XRE-family HTH domain
MVTAAQVKTARILLGWSQSELAMSAGVSQLTVARLEILGPKYPEQTAAIKRVFEEAGMTFSKGKPQFKRSLSEREILLSAEPEDDREEID